MSGKGISYFNSWLNLLGKGGKKAKKRKKGGDNTVKRELTEKNELSEYAKCLKMLGNGRLLCICTDFI